jgi:hypothetical protein
MRINPWAALAVVGMLSVPALARAQAAQQPAPAQEDAEGQPVRPSVQVGVPQGAPQTAKPVPPRPPSKPTPRWPDGKPVMGAVPGEKVGTWGSCCGSLSNDKTPFQPWAKALLADRRQNLLEPHTRCKPSGGARQFVTPYGTELVEFREMQQIMIFDIGGPHTFRTIYLDGRPHPKDLKPSYYGHSIGHWEGDTLVVDTVGFNERAWIDRAGTPHTEKLRFVERFTRTDHDTMKYEVTIDDPGAYTATWSTNTFTMTWGPNRELFEYVCQQSNFAHELMVGTFEKVSRFEVIVP